VIKKKARGDEQPESVGNTSLSIKHSRTCTGGENSGKQIRTLIKELRKKKVLKPGPETSFFTWKKRKKNKNFEGKGAILHWTAEKKGTLP